VIRRDLTLRAATALAWLGVLAFAACLLVRSVAPYPRWDLLACLLVVAAASAYWLARVCRVAGGGDGERVRYWWPRRRVVGACLAVPVLFAAALLSGVGADSATTQLQRITADGPAVAPVEIVKVDDVRRHSDQSKVRYRSEVTVTPAEGEAGSGRPQRMRGEVELRQPAEAGDLVWGLYAPDAPQHGAVLGPEEDLKALVDGGPSILGRVALVFIGLSVLGYAAVALFTRNSQPLAASLREAPDRVRCARVRVAAVTAGRHLRRDPKAKGGWDRSDLRPALRLTAGEESRELFMDRCLEPRVLAAEAEGRTGVLYWTADVSGASAASDDPARVGSAVLVLDGGADGDADGEDGGRYVYGEVSGGSDGPNLPSDAASGSPYEAAGPVYAIGPYAVWHPGSFRPAAVGLAVAFLAAVLLTTGAGAESGYGGSGLLWALVPLFVAAPAAGLMLTARRVTARLRELQRGTDGPEARDPRSEGEAAS
jgi:hypothetical protein